jgi:hypothetical protein
LFFPRPKTAIFVLALAPAAACSSVEYAGAGTTEMGDVGDGEATGDDDAGDEDTGSSDTAPEPDMGEDQEGCDPWSQDCPDGDKCTYQDDGYGPMTQCMPVDPDAKGVGEKCEVREGAQSGVDDCDAGLVCEYVNEQGFGVCVELCGGSMQDPTCSDPDAMCQVCHDDCASLCVPTCDPLAPECVEGQVCAPTNEGAFVCIPSGGKNDGLGGQGDACEYANECDDGHACVPGETVPKCEAAYCCAPYCDLGGDYQCPPETMCVPWNDDEDAPPEYEHVGVCSLP